jgi:transposase-like protein
MGEEDDMKGRHHTPEQVVRKLREADRLLLGEGTSFVEVCKHLEVCEQTYYRWRNQYGGMKADDAKRLKELERENARLKRIVADQALDIDMLQAAELGKFLSPARRRGCGRPPDRHGRGVPASGMRRCRPATINATAGPDCGARCRAAPTGPVAGPRGGAS